ncbi:carboxypeptidase-like regulatory domain-containing protein [Flavobacteriaceae bacterium 3-367]|uniref:carboxypeptidase-like regulatory domain-containing protein n=1 Tax=Eudoraea algarum TaxID=3417568 RepID=UPI0032694E95
MKTVKKSKRTVNYDISNGIPTALFALALLGLGMCLFVLIGCSSGDDGSVPPPPQSQGQGIVNGSVKDNSGKAYPNASITLSKGSEQRMTTTNADGNYSLSSKGIGAHEVTTALPLSTTSVTANPKSVNVQDGQTATVDFVIEPQAVVAHLNFGDVQLLEEIKDQDGNTPVSPTEPLYAANIFDPPLGLLTAIMAPDGHHLTLSEWTQAEGNLLARCDGEKTAVSIELEGLVPNGTYTFWLAYLKRTRKVGEPVNFASDFVHPTNPPLGSGTENVVVAAADGTINTTIEHDSCILTDEVALVIPILYHINGKTFGSGHVPDTEEVVHMLAYFQ